MSKKYTNYSRMTREDTPEEVVEPVIAEADVEPETETPSVVKPTHVMREVKGTVVDCKKLNIRSNPSMTGVVVSVVDCGAVLVIEDDNYGDWYQVRAEGGIAGYCMKKFIKTESV